MTPQGGKERETLALVVREMDQRVDQFGPLLGAENFDRWKTVALHALAQNQRVLKECSVISIIEAIRESAAMNLSPTGLLGEGWIIPYKGVATFRPGYRGLLKLLRNSGQIRRTDAQVVYMADEFDLLLGTDPQIIHRPFLFGEKSSDGELLGDRGDYRGVYGWVEMATGEKVIEWMAWADVDVVRRRSQAVAQGKDSPWDDFAGEMARKTVLRRLLKRLPLETMPQVAHAVTADEQADIIEGTATEIPPATGPRATAAAYALARGDADEPEAPLRGSGSAVEAAAADSEGCGALTPDGYEPGACIQTLGHDGNHRDATGQTWS